MHLGHHIKYHRAVDGMYLPLQYQISNHITYSLYAETYRVITDRVVPELWLKLHNGYR